VAQACVQNETEQHSARKGRQAVAEQAGSRVLAGGAAGRNAGRR